MNFLIGLILSFLLLFLNIKYYVSYLIGLSIFFIVLIFQGTDNINTFHFTKKNDKEIGLSRIDTFNNIYREQKRIEIEYQDNKLRTKLKTPILGSLIYGISTSFNNLLFTPIEWVYMSTGFAGGLLVYFDNNVRSYLEDQKTLKYYELIDGGKGFLWLLNKLSYIFGVVIVYYSISFILAKAIHTLIRSINSKR